MERKATNRHVFLGMVREVKMSRDWFRSVFIVDLNISKVFAETMVEMPEKWSVMAILRLGPEI